MTLRDVALVGSRLLVGGYFLQNAVNHFANTKQMAEYAVSQGVENGTLAVLGSGALLAVGGASILTGKRPLVGIAAATLFFAGVTPRMHRFWEIDDESRRMNEMVNFSKNIALAGAVIGLAAVERPWALSADRRRARKLQAAEEAKQAIEQDEAPLVRA